MQHHRSIAAQTHASNWILTAEASLHHGCYNLVSPYCPRTALNFPCLYAYVAFIEVDTLAPYLCPLYSLRRISDLNQNSE